MIFVDFEVFKYDWLVVLINCDDETTTVIHNDVEKLKEYYVNHKEELFVGYNIRGYDQYIFKGICMDMNSYDISKWIVGGNKGWEFSREFNNFQLYIFDIKTTFHSLKELEAFMGHEIKESDVSFDIERSLTETELEEVVRYCKHDVEQTMYVFGQRYNEFTSQFKLLEMFELPKQFMSKSKAQLASIILNAKLIPRNDYFLYSFPDTLVLSKYQEVVEWFKMSTNKHYDSKLEIEIAGVPHVFGWGGLHGSRDNYSKEGIILSLDVALI